MSTLVPFEPRRPVDAIARDWVLRLAESGDADLTAACAAWRDADPAHDAAFWRAWTLWQAAGQVPLTASEAWRAEAAALRAERARAGETGIDGALDAPPFEAGAFEHGALERGALERGALERGAPENGALGDGAPGGAGSGGAAAGSDAFEARAVDACLSEAGTDAVNTGAVRVDDAKAGEVATVAGDLSEARVAGSRRARPRFRWVALPAGLAASIAVLVTIWGGDPAPTLEVATRVAETRTVALADGSTVTVGGKSDIKAYIDAGTKERRVRLDEGQAFFEVAHDPSRPFKVIAGDAEITVRGTKFDVRRTGDDVEVNVLEGRVEVRRRGVLTFLSAGGPDAVLVAGQKSELRPEASAFAAAEPAAAVAGEWRSGRLFYADASLADIVADARRYSARRIEIASPAIGAMPLTISYRAGDIAALSASIEDALPVRVESRNDGLLIVPSGEN